MWVAALLGGGACGGKDHRTPSASPAATSSMSGAAGSSDPVSASGASAIASGGKSSAGAGNAVSGGAIASEDGGAGGAPDGASGAGGAENEAPRMPIWPFDYPIDPAALVECRAADEAACSTCCIGTTVGNSCRYKVADAGSSVWNRESSEDGACPDTCIPCASCTLDAEKKLREAPEPPSGCDCFHLQPVNDPCFAGVSCECYCSTFAPLFSACPPAP